GLVAFGGAAGLHISEVARLLEIRRVVIPNVAAVLSAWGMLATDLRYELVRTHVSEVARLAPATLRRLFAAMEADGRKRLGAFDGPISVRRALDMRYGEQIFEINVSLDGVDLARADLMDEIVARFHRRREERSPHRGRGEGGVLVPAGGPVAGAPPPLATGRAETARRAAPKATRRRVWLGDWVEVPVFRLDELPAGWETKGPALFESA